jgi:hypothetical protein
MPVAEVQRLLPRPPDEQPAESSERLADLPPLRTLKRATSWSWHLGRDFAAEMQSNLADPITPLLPPAPWPARCSVHRWMPHWSAACCWPMRRCPPSNNCMPNGS